MTADQITTTDNKPGVGRRCAVAAAVGAGLGLAYLGLMTLISSAVVCDDGWACLGWFVILMPAVLVVCALVAWPLLRAGKVGKAWQVALLGPVAVWVGSGFLTAVGLDPLIRPVLAGAAGYAAAALVTAPHLLARWRIVVVVAVAALYPLELVVTDARVASWQEDELRRYRHPLLAPDMPDYEFQGVGVIAYEPSFYYRLRSRPAAKPGPGETGTSDEIRVVQRPIRPDFNPPADCDATGRELPEPCTHVTQDVWKVSRPGYLVYFARRGDQVVEFEPGASISEADVLKAAAGLREVPPDHFPS